MYLDVLDALMDTLDMLMNMLDVLLDAPYTTHDTTGQEIIYWRKGSTDDAAD